MSILKHSTNRSIISYHSISFNLTYYADKIKLGKICEHYQIPVQYRSRVWKIMLGMPYFLYIYFPFYYITYYFIFNINGYSRCATSISGGLGIYTITEGDSIFRFEASLRSGGQSGPLFIPQSQMVSEREGERNGSFEGGDGEMGRWGDGEMGKERGMGVSKEEMGRWGDDGEMGRWGDGEMGRWGDGINST